MFQVFELVEWFIQFLDEHNLLDILDVAIRTSLLLRATLNKTMLLSTELRLPEALNWVSVQNACSRFIYWHFHS